MAEEILPMAFSAVPGIGAAILSIYNYLQARKGPDIKISQIFQYGIINLLDEDCKLFYLAIPFENHGTAVGSINSVKLELTWDGNKNHLYPVRRVELTGSGEDAILHQEDFSEQQPLFPVYVPAYGGDTFFFEFHDLENPFPIEVDIKARLIASYKDGKKKTDKEFIVNVTSWAWNRSETYNNAVCFDYIAPADDPDFKVERLFSRVRD
ncbi:MAG: hypothetical protein JSV04_08220 [Candidatus Heimdallarchaeota archaeon]|nr:MAG: hypothetical protein JSV04_08220 [Candidatus Heimdallarchaeota archaeon]